MRFFCHSLALSLYLLYAHALPAPLFAKGLSEYSTSDFYDLAVDSPATEQWSFGFGPHATTVKGDSTLVYLVSTTNHRQVAERAEIRLRGSLGAAEAGETALANVSLGSAFTPMAQDISPILGGDFGFGLRGGKEETARLGFNGAAFAGVRMFRNASSQLELSFRYEMMMSSREPKLPRLYGLQLALLW